MLTTTFGSPTSPNCGSNTPLLLSSRKTMPVSWASAGSEGGEGGGGDGGGAGSGGREGGGGEGAEVVGGGEGDGDAREAHLAQAGLEGAVVVVVAVDEARQTRRGQFTEVVVRARHGRRQDDVGELVV